MKGSATHYVSKEKFIPLNQPEVIQDNTSSMVNNEQIQEVLSCLKKRMAYEDLAKLICSLCSIKPMSKKEVNTRILEEIYSRKF